VKLSIADDFLARQNAFSAALNTYRKCHRDLMDTMLEKFDMPTQKEAEDLGRNMAEIKRELRKLRKRMSTLESDSAATDQQENSNSAQPAQKANVHILNTGYKPEDVSGVAP